jgi:TatD DNase family protein
MRGKRNEPAFVPHVGDALARILDEEPKTLARRTTENARRFYGIGGDGDDSDDPDGV